MTDTAAITVLIIDDDDVDRLAIKRALSKTTYTAQTNDAVDRSSTEQQLSQQNFDCIFMDYFLPGENGLEMVKLLRDKGVETPIIILTGQGDEDLVAEILRAGASDYLSKNQLSADALQRTLNYVMTVHDAEKERREAHDSAIESARIKSEFLANMSHEIRTPMNGVLGMLSLLTETTLDDEQKLYVDNALASGEALLNLISDILDFSKIEAGKLELECIEFDIRTLIEETLESLAEPALQKSLDLSCYIAPTANTIAVGDPMRLRQVITNLLHNANKFTQEGEISITVSIDDHNEQSSLFRFEVNDTGIGIPEEDQAHIFDSFSQGDGSTTRRFGGTGLGLAICRQLVERMEGEVGVSSIPEHGSNFWFTARFKNSDSHANFASPYQANQYPGNNILLLEPLKGVSNNLEEYIRYLGSETQTLDNTELLEQTLNTSSFDAIFISSRLINAAHEQINKLTAPPTLILMSNLGDRRNLALEYINDHLTKPIRLNALAHHLETIHTLKTTPPRPQHSARSSAPEVNTSNTYKVLLVEDNPINAKVGTAILRKLNCTTDAASDGLEALKILQNKQFDLILMDCQMPNLDGFATTQRIRENEQQGVQYHPQRPHIPIIALTANVMQGYAEKCIQIGMDDYLSKPFKVDDLEAIIQRHLT